MLRKSYRKITKILQAGKNTYNNLLTIPPTSIFQTRCKPMIYAKRVQFGYGLTGKFADFMLAVNIARLALTIMFKL